MSDEEQAPPGRSFWSGTISIGLVNVPVKLYTMIRDQSYSFHFLRKRDGCPLRYQRVCTYDNEVVEWGDVARGYEVQKGEYVTFTKEELDAIRPESDRRIKDRQVCPLPRSRPPLLPEQLHPRPRQKRRRLRAPLRCA